MGEFREEKNRLRGEKNFACQSLLSFVKLDFMMPSRPQHRNCLIRKKMENWELQGHKRNIGRLQRETLTQSLNLRVFDSENLTNTTLERNRTLKYSQTSVCSKHKINMRLMHLGILCWNTTLNTENLLGFDIVFCVHSLPLRNRISFIWDFVLLFLLVLKCMRLFR